jgi:hypothetical protein
VKFEDIVWNDRTSAFGDKWWEDRVTIADQEYVVGISKHVVEEDDYTYYNWDVEVGEETIEGEPVEEGGLPQAKSEAWEAIKQHAGI